MDITGEYRIPAARDAVWSALNDTDVLAACIPGCQTLTKESETEFSAKVTAKVGAVKATFSGKVSLADIDPPNGYTISGQGQGGVAGFAKGSARIELRSEGEETILTYTAKAEVGGKLAAVGSRLIQGVAARTADEFFACFVERVAPGAIAAQEIDAAAQLPVEPVAVEPLAPSRPSPPHAAKARPKSSTKALIDRRGPSPRAIIIAVWNVLFLGLLGVMFLS